MAQLLGQVAVGSIVKIAEKSGKKEYRVVHQGKPSSIYDDSCDGTWLYREEIYSEGQWGPSDNRFTASESIIYTLFSLGNSVFDTNVRNMIKTVKIPYCVGNGTGTINSGENGFSCRLFPLGMRELGFAGANQYIPADGDKLDYFLAGTEANANNLRIRKQNNTAKRYWSRSPETNGSYNSWAIDSSGSLYANYATTTYGIIWAMIMPKDLIVDDDGNVFEFGTPVITTPSAIMQGQPIKISWTAVDSADSYQLQRKVNSGEWTTVQTGSELAFEDTAGAWNTVQYRVAAGVSGIYGSYTESEVVDVIAASTLAISGQDSNLGTITNDVKYTIISDTGNKVSVSAYVNSQKWYSVDVDTGYVGKLSVMDLPTGSGTIVIYASVQTDSGTVTANRTWTYSKSAISFPDAAQVGVLQQDGKNILPETLDSLVRTSPFLGGTLENALKILSKAALYKTVTPTVQIGTLPEGSIIYLNENGSPVPFYVAKQNYESGLNGTGRVLVVRKYVYNIRQWNSTDVNTWESCAMRSWLNGTYKSLLDINVQSLMGTTTYYYTPGNGNTTVTTQSDAVFLLSMTELGLPTTYANVEGSALPIANSLKIAYKDGSATTQWTRSPYTDDASSAWRLGSRGDIGSGNCSYTHGSRPAFTLPATFTDYLDESTNGLYDISDNLILKLPGVQIETGSYVGTGTYGQSNKNTITFSIEPKIWGVYGYYSTNALLIQVISNIFPWGLNNTLECMKSPTTTTGIIPEYSGKTVSWYTMTANAEAQLNNNGFTYYYFAIGV